MTVSRREWLRTVLQGIGIGMVVGLRGHRDRRRAGE
jgi:flagellar basal body P-ring protein FlgI